MYLPGRPHGKRPTNNCAVCPQTGPQPTKRAPRPLQTAVKAWRSEVNDWYALQASLQEWMLRDHLGLLDVDTW